MRDHARNRIKSKTRDLEIEIRASERADIIDQLRDFADRIEMNNAKVFRDAASRIANDNWVS
jgi:hypothetical protein